MSEQNTATIQSLLRLALPFGTSLLAGEADQTVSWSLTVRAQPPAFPEIHGGELALVSMELLRAYDGRITLAEVIHYLAEAGVSAVAVAQRDEVPQSALSAAQEHQIALLALPESASLTTVERAVNTLILNQAAQITARAVEIQRQLAALIADNRDLPSLLQVMSRATAKPMIIHDDAGVILAQIYPNVGRRGPGGRTLVQSQPYSAFQNWLEQDPPSTPGVVVASPIGHTTVLKVEKRVAGYLSLMDKGGELEDFDRLILTYGADVCAIELGKVRAIASAVEQARGDWVQMWLSGTAADDDLLLNRAQQSGFDPASTCVVVVFKALTGAGQTLPLESLLSLVRDDMARRQLNGFVGQYVDVIVALYPLDAFNQLARLRSIIEEVRSQLATRTPSGLVSAGISRPGHGFTALRESYREAKDALSLAQELGDTEKTTYYGDLKLFQLLLALKERGLGSMSRFFEETLGALVEYDDRKQSGLIETLEGFFEANGNLAKAALDLNVHRNTLVYRLERISDLTGLDLDDADNRLILHLALKIQRVLATIPG